MSQLPLVDSVTLNPVADATAEDLSTMMLELCRPGVSQDELCELQDKIDAVVPALVELRDAGHIELTLRTIVENATIAGLKALAENTRLSAVHRMHAKAMHDRLIVHGVKALLGHNLP